jgi:hypothetical protein
MRRMLTAVILATGLGLAIGGSPALEAGATTHTAWLPERGGAEDAESYGPVSPIDPQQQPIWIIRIPI